MLESAHELARKIQKAGRIMKLEFLPFHRAWIAFHLNGAQSQLDAYMARGVILAAPEERPVRMTVNDHNQLFPNGIS